MLTPLDHVLALLITVVMPAYDVLLWHANRFTGRVLAPTRLASYRRTAGAEWVVAALVLMGWLSLGRGLGDIGLGLELSLGFFGSLAAALLVAVVLTWQRAELFTGPVDTEQLREEIRPARDMLPRTPLELRWFMVVSVTAGVCEEIFFRGFILWYLDAMVPLGWAVAASSILFGMAHAYQGTRGIFTNTVVAFPLAGLALWSGSLWIPMAVHAFVNLNSGWTAYWLLNADLKDR